MKYKFTKASMSGDITSAYVMNTTTNRVVDTIYIDREGNCWTHKGVDPTVYGNVDALWASAEPMPMY